MSRRSKQKSKGKPATKVETKATAIPAPFLEDPTEQATPAGLEADIEAAPAPSAPNARHKSQLQSQTIETRSPFLVLADYEQRSLAHVAGLPEQLDAPGLWRGVAYRVGSHRLASGFDEVVEILPMPAVTPVPGAQPWMLGVANVRGTLLPVVDLKQFLEGERTVVHDGQRMLVVRQSGGNVAVLIDELFGQRTFNDSHRAEMAGENEGRYGHFVNQVYRLADTSWAVFSMQTLTRTPEFRQATI